MLPVIIALFIVILTETPRGYMIICLVTAILLEPKRIKINLANCTKEELYLKKLLRKWYYPEQGILKLA
jgi:hypothetical protein